MYNGLLRAHSLNPKLGLEVQIKHFETKYANQLKNNQHYQAVENTQREFLEAKRVPATKEAHNA